jgi:Golgi transport complex subunit 5
MTTEPPSLLKDSYLDLSTLTSDDFNPYNHANTLVTRTNNPTDLKVDLSTPLSRVLFDVQEIDTHIHNVTTKSAIPILEHTKAQNESAQKILNEVTEETTRLNANYARLQKEVLGRYEQAVEARLAAERTWEVLRLGRDVQRVLNLARSLESSVSESGLGQPGRSGKEDHRALVRSTYTLLSFRDIMSSSEAKDLSRVNAVKSIRGRIFEDNEAAVREFARRVVREFAVSSLNSATFKDSQEAKSKFTSGVHILYLLSPAPKLGGANMKLEDFEPELLLRALQGYLQTAITSSSAAIARALSTLPTLERTLIEVSARCQNIVALEILLRSISPSHHPFLATNMDSNGPKDAALDANLLQPLLQALDTASLPSYFWRSLASSLSNRVQEIMNRGGVSARTLRSNRDNVRDQIRECVLKGSSVSSSVLTSRNTGGANQTQVVGNWEREAAVMIGSVVGNLGR